LNETTQEIPTYGAIAVETLADLMDAITSIVSIGMAGDSRAAIRHLSFTRFWADRLAELGDRQPSEISLAHRCGADPVRFPLSEYCQPIRIELPVVGLEWYDCYQWMLWLIY
jgi:hypothetical protein